MAQLATVATVQCAEVGKQFNFLQNSSGPNFTGSTVDLLVLNSSGVLNTFQCDISTGTPVRVSSGLEFPVAGSYIVQLKYTNGGEVYYSSEAKIVALSNLG